jgi:hypothetical protein
VISSRFVTAKAIATDADLYAIAAAGTGFVITPFTAVALLNVPACAGDDIGRRKWFAATPTDLADGSRGITRRSN